MNTNPDETHLALWLDDELEGSELAAMDQWASVHPEHLSAREEIRKFRAMMREGLPASEEPPYPDFFLSRVRQGIRDLPPLHADPVRPTPAVAPFWKSWLFPAAACAGMVLAFGIGKQSRVASPSIAVMQNAAPTVYTPEEGVDAEWFAGSRGGATVIVLEGVAAIPDTTDFSETVYIPTAHESDRVASGRKSDSDSANQ